MNEFERGRMEGALAFWNWMARFENVDVPAVDEVLDLPKDTTQKYLAEREKT